MSVAGGTNTCSNNSITQRINSSGVILVSAATVDSSDASPSPMRNSPGNTADWHFLRSSARKLCLCVTVYFVWHTHTHTHTHKHTHFSDDTTIFLQLLSFLFFFHHGAGLVGPTDWSWGVLIHHLELLSYLFFFHHAPNPSIRYLEPPVPVVLRLRRFRSCKIPVVRRRFRIRIGEPMLDTKMGSEIRGSREGAHLT